MCDTLLSATYFVSNGSRSVNSPSSLRNQIGMIENQFGSDHQCVQLIQKLSCVAVTPVCTAAEGRLIPICLESCETIDPIISDCIMTLARFTTVEEFLVNFDCSVSENYYPFPSQSVGSNENNCLQLSELP